MLNLPAPKSAPKSKPKLMPLSAKVTNTPPVLLPYQQKWFDDDSPVAVVEKSRRVGISWAEACKSTLEATKENGQDTWYIGYNKDMAQEFIRDCGMWAKAFGIAVSEINEKEEVFTDDDGDKNILTYTIRFASGYRITALSSTPNNLRGKQGRVVIDEAAFHDNLGKLLKAAFALLIWGGCVRIISTHDGVDNTFNELVNDIRSGRLPYSLHRITFDEAIADGLYQRICLTTSHTWTIEEQIQWTQSIRDIYKDNVDEELNVIPKNGGGKYLSRALIESRMSAYTQVIRWRMNDDFNLLADARREKDCQDWIDEYLHPLLARLPFNARGFIGGDFGRTGDLSVFVPLLQTQKLGLSCPFTIELGNIPFKQQEQILFWLADGLPRLIGMALDARGLGATLAEYAMQRYGANCVTEVKFTEDWYRQHMPPFKAAFEDGTIDALPKDADVLDDLRAFEVINGVARIPDKRSTGKDGNKRHGDSAIALLLAHYASRELRMEFGYMSVPRHDEIEYESNRQNRFDDFKLEKSGAW